MCKPNNTETRIFMKETKFDVFVAYSRKDDSGFVSLLLDRIDGLGVKVWNGGENIFDGEFPNIVPAPLYYRAIYVGNETVTVSSDIVKTGISNSKEGSSKPPSLVLHPASRKDNPINSELAITVFNFKMIKFL